MCENAKKSLEQIGSSLAELPQEVATNAMNQIAARMEGFAEGFAAAQACAQNRSA